MNIIYGIILGFHILICAVLILVVLLQSGKGGGLAGAFGAAGGQTGQMLFGGRGAATFLSKATTVLGSVFLVTSLVLALLQAGSGGGSQSVIRAAEPGTVSPPLSAPAPATGLEDLELPGGTPATIPGEGAAPAGETAPPTGETGSGETTPAPETPGEQTPPGGN